MSSETFIMKLVFPFLFVLSRIRFIHPLIPRPLLMRLPVGWSLSMFMVFMFSNGKMYVDIPCTMPDPPSYKPKVKSSFPEYQLTEQDIKFFYDNGYTQPFTIISPEEMEPIKDHIYATMQTESSIYPLSHYKYVGKPEAKVYSNNEISNEAVARQGIKNRDRHLDDLIIAKLLTHPAITERVAQLLGPNLLEWRSQFFPLAPKAKGTAFHQASVYLFENFASASLTPQNKDQLFQVTAWVALTDCTTASGCMHVIPGTHRKINPVQYSTYDPNRKGGQRFGAKDIRIDYPVEEANPVPMIMKPGQFFIFSERVIHGSLPNDSEHMRMAINCRIIIPETRIFHPHLFKYGNEFNLLKLKKIRLDNWRPVQIRGEDTAKVNGDRIISKEKLLQDLAQKHPELAQSEMVAALSKNEYYRSKRREAALC